MRNYEKELISLLIARRLSINTINIYKSRLKEYLGFCYSNGVLPEDMPHEALVDFLAQDGSESLCGQRRALLVNLYEFILCQGFKLMHLPYAKKKVTVPESLSAQQIGQIFSVIRNKKALLALKIMYAAGLRISEVVKLHINELRKKHHPRTGKEYFEIKITGKGNKERLVPLPDQTASELLSFIERNKITGYIFKGQFKSFYSERSIWNVFNEAKLKCGITVNGSCHLLRKSRTTHLIDGNINDRNIMLMMGWSQSKTINHYHRASTSAIKDAIDSIDAVINKNLLENKTRLIAA